MALKPSVNKSSKGGFAYKERSPDSVKRRAEQTGSRFDTPYNQKFDMYRPKNGDNLIRFLPPTWDEADHYGFDVWVHQYVGPDNSTYICLYKMQKKHCPICKAQREAHNAGEEAEAKDLAPVKKVAAWVIDRDEDNAMPRLFVMGWTIDRDVNSLCRDVRSGKTLSIDHDTVGYDVAFKRSGQGKTGTKYFGYVIDRDPSPISDDDRTQRDILDFIEQNPIPSVLVYHDAAYLEKVISGTSEPTEEEEEEDKTEEVVDEPRPRRQAKAAKQPEPEDEVRDEDFEDEPLEEQEEKHHAVQEPPWEGRREAQRPASRSKRPDVAPQPKATHRGPHWDDEAGDDDQKQADPEPRRAAARREKM